jgi:hypothetical protein
VLWWPDDCKASMVCPLAATVIGTDGYLLSALTVPATASSAAEERGASASSGFPSSAVVVGAAEAVTGARRGRMSASRSFWVPESASV